MELESKYVYNGVFSVIFIKTNNYKVWSSYSNGRTRSIRHYFINSQKEIFWPFICAIISSDILTNPKNSFISLSLILGTCNSQTTTTKFDVLERSNSIVLVDVIESDNSYSTDLAKEVMMDVE